MPAKSSCLPPRLRARRWLAGGPRPRRMRRCRGGRPSAGGGPRNRQPDFAGVFEHHTGELTPAQLVT